jgi:hypothetical protein
MQPDGGHIFRISQEKHERSEEKGYFNERHPKNTAGQFEEHNLKFDAQVHQQKLFFDACCVGQESFSCKTSVQIIVVSLSKRNLLFFNLL